MKLFFFYQKDLSAWTANIYWPNSCSSHLPVNCFFPFRPQTPTPFPFSSGWLWASRAWLPFSFHVFCGLLCIHSYICFCSLNLFYVNLIIRPANTAGREEGKYFPPLQDDATWVFLRLPCPGLYTPDPVQVSPYLWSLPCIFQVELGPLSVRL